MRAITVHVSDHAIGGSSLRVLHNALLRELARQARREGRARQPGTRTLASRERQAAEALCREAGCTPDEIARAAKGRASFKPGYISQPCI